MYRDKDFYRYRYLIETNQLDLEEDLRVYMKVPELPFGKQLQLDFGEYRTGSGLALYIFAAVLSASRYTYVAFQGKPFTAIDLIGHLLDDSEYIGGIPEELVIDQDAVMVVSENHGEIIYTRDFDSFIEVMGLKMYVCRKADHETKGKISQAAKRIPAEAILVICGVNLGGKCEILTVEPMCEESDAHRAIQNAPRRCRIRRLRVLRRGLKDRPRGEPHPPDRPRSREKGALR